MQNTRNSQEISRGDVSLDELEVGQLDDLLQVLDVGAVIELVEDNDLCVFVCGECVLCMHRNVKVNVETHK